MLAELKLELEADDPAFGYYQSSNLQGVIMEQIDQSYAEQLHVQGRKPYSQYVRRIGEQKIWVINTLTKEAYEQMIMPLLDHKFQQFDLDKRKMHIQIRKKEIKVISYKQLMDEFYSNDCSRYLHLEFITPTSFKSKGAYVIMPDTRYIFQSLMNKYSAVSMDMDMYDEETLLQLTESSHIIKYHLKSAVFPLEGVKIPSFQGKLSMKLCGTRTMANYVKLLARFGEYSGVGIKTAMGMGGIKINDRYGDKADIGRSAS